MSTILDALRKAQEETGDKRQTPVGEHPAATEAVSPATRRRRPIGWPVVIVGVLGLAFVGGLAFGDRIAALLGGATDPALPAEVQVAARTEPAEVPAPDAAVKQKPAADAASPAARRGKSPEKAQAAAATRGTAPAAAVKPVAPAGSPEVAPTPYGQLHVFGAGERPTGDKPSAEDRLARLQQLREKMLKARKDAASRGTQEEAPAAPAQIFVPPPHDAAPGPATASRPAAAAPSAEQAAPRPADVDGSATPRQVPHEATGEVARGSVAAPQQDAAQPAPAEVDAPAPAVGVSVASEHADSAGAGSHAPDVAADASGVATTGNGAAGSLAPAPDAEPAAAPEPAVAVAALAGTGAAAPAGVAAAQPVAAAAPPVLRRAPGGAPQVAINILQWSLEPARRFAFVSVDGGNMTQVREGDRIGGLTIKHIHQQMIEFGFNDATFLLRAN